MFLTVVIKKNCFFSLKLIFLDLRGYKTFPFINFKTYIRIVYIFIIIARIILLLNLLIKGLHYFGFVC